MIHSKKRSLHLVALSPLAVACMAMSAQAATRVDLHAQDVARINARSAGATVAAGVSKQASVRHAQMLGLGAESALTVLKVHTSKDGVRNTRYQQTFRGLPIYGEQVVVSEDRDGNVRTLFGRKVEGLESELPAVAAKVGSAQALSTAKRAALGSRLLSMKVQAEKSRQVVFVVANGRAERRPIEIGQRQQGTVEVAAGLRPGEQIVVRGLQRARHGLAVNARPFVPEGGTARPPASDATAEDTSTGRPGVAN